MGQVEVEVTVRVEPPGRSVDLVLCAPAGTRLADLTPAVLTQLGLTQLGLTQLGPTSLGQSGTETLQVASLDGASLGDPFSGATWRDLPLATLGQPPLVRGALLRVTSHAEPCTRGVGVAQVHVLAGPDAGHVASLPAGRSTLGCAEVDVGAHGVRVREVASTGAWSDLPPDAVVAVGDNLLGRPRRTPHGRGSLTPTGDGYLTFTSVGPAPPATPPGAGPGATIVDLPAAPERRETPSLALVSLLVPVLVAVPLAFWWSPVALLLSVGGPVASLTTLAGERRRARRRRRTDLAAFATDVRATLARVRTLEDDVARERSRQVPDPASVLLTALNRTPGLWSRTAEDAGAFTVRLGLHRGLSGVSVRALHRPGHPTRQRFREHVPLLLDLADARVVGICGPAREALVRAVVGQLATRLGQHELSLELPAPDTGGDEGPWTWTRWLPHGTGGPGTAPTGPPAAARVVVIDATCATPPPTITAIPTIPAAATAVIVLADHRRHLPTVCRTIVNVTSTRLRLEQNGVVTECVPDLVGDGWIQRLGRSLAPLRPAGDTDVTGVAGGTRLVELLTQDDGDPHEAATIGRRWARGSGGLRAVVGRDERGPWAIDLVNDGPHVLVAGMTGSGKSEFLTSLVVSLAVAAPPEDLAFVLVDYKGGASFAPLAKLPHTVGIVTDLDGHLAQRVLMSLRAEVRRRERLLREAGCRDVAEWLRAGHHKVRREGTDDADASMPRLVIVVDEFRVLAEELGTFVDALVRLAAVGRSLGIHLVLATQRPAGVVSADIRANTNLRIALRVRDETDSTDVVDSPAAAHLTRPGQALVRAGAQVLRQVQVARVTGPSPRIDTGIQVRAMRPGARAAARAAVRTTGNPSRPEPEALGDLPSLVEALRIASAGHARPRAPWTPPLPDLVNATDLPSAEPDDLLLGLLDDPAAQCRRREVWTPRAPLIVAGPARSGRTSTLRTLAHGVTSRCPGRWHLVVIQGRGRGLDALRDAPHTVAVADADDTEHLLRVLAHLEATVRDRQADPAGRRPRIVLLVDGADDLLTGPGSTVGLGGRGPSTLEAEEIADRLYRLLTDGPAVEVVPVLSGDRRLLAPRLTSTVTDRLLLGLREASDAALIGVRPADVPARMPPGRALRAREGAVGDVQEIQVAWIEPDPDPVREPCPDPDPDPDPARDPIVAARHAQCPTCRPVRRVPALPRRVTSQDLLPWRVTDGWVPLGIGDDGGPHGLDIAATPTFLVGGPSRSGRTSTLLLIAAELHAAGRAVLVISPRPSALVTWAAATGVPTWQPSEAADGAALRLLADWSASSPVPAPVPSSATGPLTVLIDDVELLEGCGFPYPALERLTARASAAAPGTGAVIAAGTGPDLAMTHRGLVPALRRGRHGLLLHPIGAAEADLLGVRVPRRGPGVPGRASLLREGTLTTVQLARHASGEHAMLSLPRARRG